MKISVMTSVCQIIKCLYKCTMSQVKKLFCKVEHKCPDVLIQSQGTVCGKLSKDNSFFEYLGIPYATTSKATRFQAPLPPPKWEGIFHAKEESPCSPQSGIFGITGEEEGCLSINVYVPVKPEKPLPVMVFIHGGAFIFGSGGKNLLGPEFLVKNDVILVTMNYRLGALGFLSLGIKEAPGNAGLKDQVAALRWVKSNIAAFGGDDENITLFGESAGAVSTSYMIATPVTDGLFHKAILQSGSSTGNWSLNKNPVWTASLLGKAMGFESEDPYELYEFFKNAPVKDFLKAKTRKPNGKFYDTQLIHLPCVEKEFEGVERVVPDIPYKLLKNTKKNIQIIYGTNDREGLFIVGKETEANLSLRNEGYLFASDLEFPSETEAKEADKAVKEYYFGKEPVSLKEIKSVEKLYTQLYFEVPSFLETNILLDKKLTVYNYNFKYAGYRNVVKFITGHLRDPGACHADDLFYLFHSKYWPFWITAGDQRIIDVMTKLWTNFAKYGDPTPKENELDFKWVPSEKDNLQVLYIDKEQTMGGVPDNQAYLLWKDIYANYRKMT